MALSPVGLGSGEADVVIATGVPFSPFALSRSLVAPPPPRRLGGGVNGVPHRSNVWGGLDYVTVPLPDYVGFNGPQLTIYLCKLLGSR